MITARNFWYQGGNEWFGEIFEDGYLVEEDHSFVASSPEDLNSWEGGDG